MKDCKSDAHLHKVAAKGNERAGELPPILANRQVDTSIILAFLKSVNRPDAKSTPENMEGNTEIEELLEAAQKKADENMLRCSKRTSTAPVRAELGLQSPRTGDVGKLKSQCHENTWVRESCAEYSKRGGVGN